LEACDIREFDPVGDWDALVFSDVLSYLAVHEAIAEVRRYAKALSPEGMVAVSMMNDGKSRAIWRALREEFRWIDGILWQQKEPWPSYRISVSRERPGYLVGVLGLLHKPPNFPNGPPFADNRERPGASRRARVAGRSAKVREGENQDIPQICSMFELLESPTGLPIPPL
jgi:hypothetical protein